MLLMEKLCLLLLLCYVSRFLHNFMRRLIIQKKALRKIWNFIIAMLGKAEGKVWKCLREFYLKIVLKFVDKQSRLLWESSSIFLGCSLRLHAHFLSWNFILWHCGLFNICYQRIILLCYEVKSSFVLPHYNHWRGNAWGSFKFQHSTKIFIVKQVLRENVQCKVRVECTSYEKSEKEFHPLKVKWMKNMKSRKSREQKDIKRMKMYGKAQFALMESFSLSLLHKRDENSHTFSLRHKKSSWSALQDFQQ